ncbi:MAG TPA: LysR substrate-binding domain-containing protein [Casimicrobiaceae bacterium]|nr:LysR substrate-binding domain-containing protein [Casimicrobiaceae bacterium]
MLDLKDVHYFVQAVEKKGISAAARALDLPKSTVSRRILSLEAALGARLIQRTTRGFAVTEVGQEFYKRALATLVEAESAENVVRQRVAEPSGTIRFSCPVALAQLGLAELIPRFMALYPRIRIVQHATNRFVDPVQDGFDVCLRAHSTLLPASTLIQRRLVDIPWHLFAGPAYLARKGTPASPEELPAHDAVGLQQSEEAYVWSLTHEEHPDRKATVSYTPCLQSDDMGTLKVAARTHGIVALPGYVGRNEVESGLLVRVLPQWHAGIATLSVLLPSRRGLLPSVRAFIDFLNTHVPPALS